MYSEPTKQLSFRLPQSLVGEVDACTRRLRTHGLHVSRSDVVRLLLVHALRATGGDLHALLDGGGGGGTKSKGHNSGRKHATR